MTFELDIDLTFNLISFGVLPLVFHRTRLELVGIKLQSYTHLAFSNSSEAAKFVLSKLSASVVD